MVEFLVHAKTNRAENIQKYLWGTYKPHLLYSLQSKQKLSFQFGVAFADNNWSSKSPNYNKMRWQYDNKENGVFTEFLVHNGKDLNECSIDDKQLNMNANIKFLREDSSRSWMTAITQKFPFKPSENQRYLHNFLYFALSKVDKEDQKTQKFFSTTQIQVENELNKNPNQINFQIHSERLIQNLAQPIQIKEASVEIIFSGHDIITHEQCYIKQIVKYAQLGSHLLWDIQQNIKDLFLNHDFDEKSYDYDEEEPYSTDDGESEDIDEDDQVKRNIQETSQSKEQQPQQEEEYNFLVVDVVSDCSIEIDVVYHSNLDQGNIKDRKLNSMNFYETYKTRQLQFIEEIKEQFLPKQIQKTQEDIKSNQDQLVFVISVLSNLIGGICNYSGELKVDNSQFKHSQKTSFSGTPSRKIFPRSFLWDDGFHNTILCRYDLTLCQIIIEQWIDKMDVLGWIAREQVRGEEISSKVPQDFVSQDSLQGNPPTLLFAIESMVGTIKKPNKYRNPTAQHIQNQKFLETIYPKLEQWYQWYRNTQAHVDNREEDDLFDEYEEFKQPILRWRCKGTCHTGMFLGSGLDDYPREQLNTFSIQHVDIHCWMSYFSRVLRDIAQQLQYDDQMAYYNNIHASYMSSLHQSFLDPTDFQYKDVAGFQYLDPQNQYLSFNTFQVNQTGYISLFPLFFGFIDNELAVQKALQIIKEELWSDYGIRSLSPNSQFYGQGDDYWRGLIWMPINYLIMKGLSHYSKNYQLARQLCSSLKDNLKENIYQNWNESGYLWETYLPDTGKGKRGHPFNGWTSLVINLYSIECHQQQ